MCPSEWEPHKQFYDCIILCQRRSIIHANYDYAIWVDEPLSSVDRIIIRNLRLAPSSMWFCLTLGVSNEVLNTLSSNEPLSVNLTTNGNKCFNIHRRQRDCVHDKLSGSNENWREKKKNRATNGNVFNIHRWFVWVSNEFPMHCEGIKIICFFLNWFSCDPKAVWAYHTHLKQCCVNYILFFCALSFYLCYFLDPMWFLLFSFFWFSWWLKFVFWTF